MMKYTPNISRFISKHDLIQTMDIIHLSLSCKNDQELSELIDRIKTLVPFKYATCVLAGMDSNGLKLPYDHININYPDEWSRLYASRQYFRIDPIFQEHFRSFKLQYWSETYKINEPPGDFLKLSSDFGLLKGFTHGVRNQSGSKASLFSVSGEGLDKEQRFEYILQHLVPHMHQALERIARQKRTGNTAPLSAREREVLKWLSQGKTAWETSTILGVSERTIRYHIANITQKLDAVSCIHAAAIAIDLGLIEIE